MAELLLPKGWRREEQARKLGLSAGKVDVSYYGPDGQRYRNKQQLVKALGKFVDLSAFDFRTGKINPALVRKSKQNKQKGYPIYEYLRGLKPEACLVPPIRQTASIFKQPVTLISNRNESTTKHDTKHGVQEKKSKQLFWERRLQGLSACDPHAHTVQPFDLPRNIRGVSQDLSQDTLLRSVATYLHITQGPIVGQLNVKGQQDKHPAVYLNPDQPLVQTLIVTDDDIRRQEEQVVLARKQLENAYKELREI
ncbi:methyl-CpG-binding domain protein 2 [Galendromus occidentalis]|uniref:Methyl-CpG-binding domain protein 2 n=1 Tax=Galendromus occidentalis TaxID=34638 RepID=A0AAJ6QV58_9ACAR|nr:methyl-CpG-binding domain protein 2 [Galendromus occidentalis]